MLAFLKRLASRYGFGREKVATLSPFDDWSRHPFFTEHQRKNERLAEIARERSVLKLDLAKAVKQKKARAPIYQALRALSAEEMKLEQGR